ncbi:MAG TPA: S8 family serine peptidase [Isosphaeraceae bacterium]|nr:S8 family serine peptidase [Isosphaeraceae bacterium]
MADAQNKMVKRQVERILDETTEDKVDVIVQMESDRPELKKLGQAAGVALSRRRMSLTPRELLPQTYHKPVKGEVRQQTASTYSLLGKAAKETLTLAKIQKLGEEPLDPLLKSGLVKSAIARMVEPAKKSAGPKPAPNTFWTSRAMPLVLERDELSRLPEEVKNIRSVHLNRALQIPQLMEIRPAQEETGTTARDLSATWGLLKVNALAAWGVTGSRGEGVLIGLLDTGVDASHPDLKDKVAHWVEFDSLGIPVVSQPHDSDEHGTHCAGTLAGGNASGRQIGMAPAAKLAAAMVLRGEDGGIDAQVLAGIDWCVERKVDLISMSLGGLVMDAETPPTYTEAILTCLEAGIPVVAAIGNEGEQTTGSPGNDLFALSVGATDPQDRVAGFSGGRTHILRKSDFIDPRYLPLPYSKPEISAPGVAIYSSVPGGKWKAFSGTSMATPPHVAGGIALLLSATKIHERESGIRRATLLKDLILGSVEELGECGQDHRYGFGRLDVLRTIDFALERGYARSPKES